MQYNEHKFIIIITHKAQKLLSIGTHATPTKYFSNHDLENLLGFCEVLRSSPGGNKDGVRKQHGIWKSVSILSSNLVFPLGSHT